MAEWLILRLPRAADGNASWQAIDAEGRPLQPLQSGPLAGASAAAAGRRVVALVPAADVLLTDVELPQGAGGRAAQLVPFALEEQLVGDLEAQHFALGRLREGRLQPVAIAAHARVEAWLGALRAAGIEPTALHAAHALLPEVPGQAVATLDGNELCLRAPGHPARCIEAAPGSLAASLGLLLGDGGDALLLALYTTPADWQAHRAECELLQSRAGGFRPQLLNTGLLPWQATHAPAAQAINLLQGRYQASQSSAATWQRWRVAAVLAAVLLLAHVGVQGWRLHQLRRDSAALEPQLLALSAGVPAGAGALRARVEQALLASQSAGNQAGLLPALQALSGALRAVPDARVLALDFRDGVLQLKLKAADAQALERISQSLQSAGWQSQVLSGASVAGAFEGNLRVSRGAS